MTEVESQYQGKICVAKTFVNSRIILMEGGHREEVNVKQRDLCPAALPINTKMKLVIKSLAAPA